MNKLVLAVLLCTLVTGQEPLIVGQEPPIEPQIEAYTIAYSTDNPVLEFLKLSGPLPAYGIWIFARTTEINAVAFRATVRYEKDGIESEQKTIFEDRKSTRLNSSHQLISY